MFFEFSICGHIGPRRTSVMRCVANMYHAAVNVLIDSKIGMTRPIFKQLGE